MPFSQNRFFVQIWLFEVSDEKNSPGISPLDLKRTWFKWPFFQNRFLVQIWLFEVSDQKIKFDGMFKMPGRDFEKFSFSAGKMADSQNPGFKSEKTLRCTVSHQLYYLWSTFGDVSSDFDEIFMIFKNLYGSEKAC